MYLLDANVFITPKNTYYSFDLAPGYWVFLEECHRQKALASIDYVYDELVQGKDRLGRWVSDHKEMFIATKNNARMAPVIGEIASWAESCGRYRGSAVKEFVSDSADIFLIAYAKLSGGMVVTFETSAPNVRHG